MIALTKHNIDEQALISFGEKLGSKLFAGAFIALYGDLGAGKTTLTKGIAKALGIDDISSPTFLIVEEHDGRIPLFHFDAYRLSSSEELYDIGFDDYIERNGVIIMEWCENVVDALSKERLEIEIKGNGFAPREITIRAFGKPYEDLLELIK